MLPHTLERYADEIHAHAITMLFPLIGFTVDLDKSSTRVDESCGTAYGFIRTSMVANADLDSNVLGTDALDSFVNRRVSDSHLTTKVVSFKRHAACSDSRGTPIPPYVVFSWKATFETPQTDAARPKCVTPKTIWARLKTFMFGDYAPIPTTHSELPVYGGKRSAPDGDRSDDEPLRKRHNSTSSPPPLPPCPHSPSSS